MDACLRAVFTGRSFQGSGLGVPVSQGIKVGLKKTTDSELPVCVNCVRDPMVMVNYFTASAFTLASN